MKKHVRVNETILGFIEKPLLTFFVKIMPKWVNPDVLTSLGFIASIVTGVSYFLTNFNKTFLWLSSLGLVLNWFGDSLDGSLARYRKIERPNYGYFLDHTIDCLSQTMIILGFGLSPYVDYKLASLVLTGYFSLSIITYTITNIEGVFKISYGKMGPTEARVLAVIVNTFIYYFENPFIKLPFVGYLGLIDLAFALVAFFLYFSFFVVATRKIVYFSRVERRK